MRHEDRRGQTDRTAGTALSTTTLRFREREREGLTKLMTAAMRRHGSAGNGDGAGRHARQRITPRPVAQGCAWSMVILGGGGGCSVSFAVPRSC